MIVGAERVGKTLEKWWNWFEMMVVEETRNKRQSVQFSP